MEVCEETGVVTFGIRWVTSTEVAGAGESGVWIIGAEAALIDFSGRSIAVLFDDALFLTGFFSVPWRTGLGSGLAPAGRSISLEVTLSAPSEAEAETSLASVSFTSRTSASDIKGLAIVAATLGQRSAVAIISGTWPDIITTGIRAVASL